MGLNEVIIPQKEINVLGLEREIQGFTLAEDDHIVTVYFKAHVVGRFMATSHFTTESLLKSTCDQYLSALKGMNIHPGIEFEKVIAG